jgi:hypothetical protein
MNTLKKNTMQYLVVLEAPHFCKRMPLTADSSMLLSSMTFMRKVSVGSVADLIKETLDTMTLPLA